MAGTEKIATKQPMSQASPTYNRADLEAANINPDSHLATDYLNHFNEIVMLMEMLPDMPDMLDEALEWQPKSYSDHFSQSSFQGKDLAIEAYEQAPNEVRDVFDPICQQLDKTILQTLTGMKLVAANDRGLSAEAQNLLRNRVETIQALLMKLNQVIHAKFDSSIMADVAKLTGKLDSAQKAEEQTAAHSDAQTQEDIDKLFD